MSRAGVHVYGAPAHSVARRTLLLGFATSFPPNLSVSADSTAIFTSRGFTHRNAGVFLSAVMAAPMFVHPVIAVELTYSETALERASGVMLNPVGVMNVNGEEIRRSTRAGICALTNTTFMIELGLINGQRVCLEELDSGYMPRREPDVIDEDVETHRSLDPYS